MYSGCSLHFNMRSGQTYRKELTLWYDTSPGFDTPNLIKIYWF